MMAVMRTGPKRRQFGGVSQFLKVFGTKKHSKYRYDVFGASQAKNHGIYEVVCPW